MHYRSAFRSQAWGNWHAGQESELGHWLRIVSLTLWITFTFGTNHILDLLHHVKQQVRIAVTTFRLTASVEPTYSTCGGGVQSGDGRRPLLHSHFGKFMIHPILLSARSVARLAQSAERKALNRVVVGSSHTVGECHGVKYVQHSQPGLVHFVRARPARQDRGDLREGRVAQAHRTLKVLYATRDSNKVDTHMCRQCEHGWWLYTHPVGLRIGVGGSAVQIPHTCCRRGRTMRMPSLSFPLSSLTWCNLGFCQPKVARTGFNRRRHSWFGSLAMRRLPSTHWPNHSFT